MSELVAPLLDAEEMLLLRRVLRIFRERRITGPGVVFSPDGITINSPAPAVSQRSLRIDLFRVLLTQIGGASGSNSTRCTFTYDVFLWADTNKVTKLNSSAVEVSGNNGRNQLGPYTAATQGLAFYDSDGSLKLWSTNEFATVTACS